MLPKGAEERFARIRNGRTTRNRRRLFGTNGIRGLANVKLTPEFAMKIGGAIGTFLEEGHMLVGYDGRISSPMLAKAVIAGLTSTGCTVYNVGMTPTPAIQYAVRYHKMDGAVMVTASHNPPEYNGIKVIADDGIELSRQREIEVEDIFSDDRIRKAKWNAVGEARQLPRILDVYRDGIKKHIDVTAIQKKRFHVIVDSGNAVGGLVAPYLLREIGCKVTTMNANIDGTFPGRTPEPRPESLGELSSIVSVADADLGVAYDGDADRSIFVDERGEVYWGDRTFGLIERSFLQDNPGEKIVTPVSSSILIKDVADEYGGDVVWTKVGSIIVAHTMKKVKAKLGGEENGGVFYAPHQPVRDGAMTTALILDIMAKTGKKLSKLLAELPRYHIKKDKITCPNELKKPILEELTQQIRGMSVDTTDGVKIGFPDKSSILIRPSGTEPIYRFYAEGKTRKRTTQLLTEYKAKADQLVDELTNN
ncbi:MAG: phosphoglucosamine mutase [Candidatus Bathyarchaeota archaeon]|nr:MAG: phosphoglucosamine mutase [Candidatus Bathyarchaeota archaeon]